MVRGFRFSGVAAGIKSSGAPDLAVVCADAAASAAGVFTRNLVVAAPVVYCRETLRGRARAIVVNSGNANACTGDRGLADARRMAALAAGSLGLAPDDVLVCSTGVLGAPLPMDRLEVGIPRAAAAIRADGLADFAEAIRTTDTRPKVRRAGGHGVTVAGAAKGSGMIHPDMATMLGFVFTDARSAPGELDEMWRDVCARTFNAITVDGDTSTNDTALVMASGHVRVESQALYGLLLEVARELALDIVRDGEGGTKTVAVRVTGARDVADARRVAETIALSPLVKTALHGEDPNWGRIIAAAGRAGVDLDPAALQLWIGDALLYAQATWQGAGAEAAAHETMCTAEYGLRLDLAAGPAEHTAYTCDLSAGYVAINADYRS